MIEYEHGIRRQVAADRAARIADDVRRARSARHQIDVGARVAAAVAAARRRRAHRPAVRA